MVGLMFLSSSGYLSIICRRWNALASPPRSVVSATLLAPTDTQTRMIREYVVYALLEVTVRLTAGARTRKVPVRYPPTADDPRVWKIKEQDGITFYDKIYLVESEGKPVKGVGTRERWRKIDVWWHKLRKRKFVVERMRWVKKDGVFCGTFDWVRYDRNQEWTADGHRKFCNPPSSLQASALKSGILLAIPQEILLWMVHEAFFVRSETVSPSR